MTPEFALDLSHDGISLLRRSDDGWRRVGAVSLDADGLNDDLAALRAKAGGAIRSKLVIPNSQILYTSCRASGKDELADEVRVRAALVGATPYPVSELVFDWESDGETLQIAVVARETLEEARTFAEEHGFGPLGFVAVPPRGAFVREPFFGPADRGPGSGPAMVADAEPIEVLGDWEEPAPKSVPEAAPVAGEPDEAVAEPEGAEAVEAAAAGESSETVGLEAPDAQADGLADESAASGEPAAVPGEAEAEPCEVEAEPDATGAVEEVSGAVAVTPEAGEAEARDAGAELEDVTARDEASDGLAEDIEASGKSSEEPIAASSVGEVSATEAVVVEEAVPVASFSSIRASAAVGRAPKLGGAQNAVTAGAVRKLGGASRDETPASPPPRPQRADKAAKAEAAPKATAPKATAPKATAPKAATPKPAAPKPAAPKPAARKAEAPAQAPRNAAVADPEIAPQEASPASKAAVSSFRDRVAALRRTPDKGALTPEIIAAPLPRPAPEELPKREAQGPDRGDFTIFGARGKPAAKSSRGFPVGLTLALLVLLGGAGLFSKLFLSSDEGTVADAPLAAEQSLITTGSAIGGEGSLTRSITFGEAGTSGATTEPQGEAALAEVLEAPAGVAPAPEGAPMDLASLADDPFSALPEEAPQIAEPMLETPPLPEIDADVLTPEDELADVEPEPEAVAAPVSAEEAQAAYAETGVWQRSPEPASLPDEESTNDIYIASIDPSVSPVDAVALPRPETGGGSDAALPPQPGTVPPGQVVEFDEDGNIRPTDEGVVTPDGVTLYAGRPRVVPRQRPGGLAEAGAEAERVSLEAAPADGEAETDPDATEVRAPGADVRPRARPAGLIEGNEKATLGGRTRAELAGLRPRQRPESLQDQAEAARQAAIEQAVASSEAESADLAQDAASAEAEARSRAEAELRSASKLAVASSRSPAARPRGFDSKVAAARRQAEAQEAERVAAAARRSAPAAPEADDDEGDTGGQASAAVVLPRTQKVAPPVPSSASVAKAATDRNALKLRDINLIGVFGSPSQRRALVRLPSGRLIKVKAGDSLDGGKVAAIGEHDLRYVKRGKNITLSMPSG